MVPATIYIFGFFCLLGRKLSVKQCLKRIRFARCAHLMYTTGKPHFKIKDKVRTNFNFHDNLLKKINGCESSGHRYLD